MESDFQLGFIRILQVSHVFIQGLRKLLPFMLTTFQEKKSALFGAFSLGFIRIHAEGTFDAFGNSQSQLFKEKFKNETIML